MGEVARRLEGHHATVLGAAFDLGGTWLATASKDKTVGMGSLATGERRRTLRNNADQVTSVTFIPDGQWLGFTSRDLTARLWPAKAF